MLLSNMTVSFPMGKPIVVMGRSGCGKSTLLNLIAGLERPTRGTIEHYCRNREARTIDFTGIPDNKVVDFRRKNIGFVFQRFNLLSDLTVFQNVLMAARLAGMNSSDATDATFDALKSVELSHLEGRRPDSLSGGEAQRVGIARAIVKRPQLLLADEPTGNLDSQTASTVIASLIAVVEQIQGTLIMVTHDSMIASNFRTVYKLDAGSLILCGNDGLL
jgi:putative ABC transport system ATP-binding protein